jgi:hypothetical protein
MPKMHPSMKLSLEEESFLRHWMFDETHYRDGPGLAKKCQIAKGVTPADLATLIAAALPDPADQSTAGKSASTAGPPVWPWSEQSFRARLHEAQEILAERDHVRTSKMSNANHGGSGKNQ